MCKAIDDMKKEAADKAVENNRLESIKNLMETMKWTAEQAMNALKISSDEQGRLVKMP